MNAQASNKRIYSRRELFAPGGKQHYPRHAKEAAFPLGGIGTGNVSVGARGELRDWEIFNWPGKKNFLPFSFFALWAKQADKAPVARILESDVTPHYNRSHGFLNGDLAGLPRFADSQLSAGYPFVEVSLRDKEVPVDVTMEAFTPFVPLNAEDSAIPGAIIRYRVHNPTDDAVEVSVVGTLANAVGFDGYDVFANLKLAGEVQNEHRREGGLEGLYYTSKTLEPDDFKFGSMAIATTNAIGVFARPVWLEGEWTDNAQDFWEDFRDDGLLDPPKAIKATGSALKDYHDFSFLNLREKIGSIGAKETIPPHEERTFEFLLTWHFPNRPKGWIEFDKDIADYKAGKYEPIRNHYATIHEDAWAAARCLAERKTELEGHSRAFENAIYSTSLPGYVIDAITANIASLRSHCCFRIEDGSFLGWEGIRDYVGCGQGNVNHVWNYAQTVAYLFPELERSMRNIEFNVETDETGNMPFRARTILGQDRWAMIPAADGEMGSIMRVYREWKLSGDDEFLKGIWKKTQLAMEFSIRNWDPDGDGLTEAQSSNTYDIEFYGPNPMMGFIYCGALKACSEMARHLGDERLSTRYFDMHKKSSAAIEAILWDGEYFVQRLNDVDAHRYQHGIGCHSDQLLGQFIAYSAGLGPLVQEEKLRSAAAAVFAHNFLPELRALHSVQRTYALNDEPGLVLCTWPKGGRPRFAFAYCDEVWTGVEYQVAASLVHAGLLDEAFTVIKALRSRYDGIKRNPWSEIEAGHHYIRAMASFGVLTAVGGYEADLVNKRLRFAPKMSGPDFKTFWICGKAWGTFTLTEDAGGHRRWSIDVLYGNLDGIEVSVADA